MCASSRKNVLVFLVLFGLASQGAFGFPGIQERPKTAPPSVTALEARIKKILSAGSTDNAAASNSTSGAVNGTGVTCGLSESSCNCSGSQCDCSKGKCLCLTGNQQPSTAEVVAVTDKNLIKRNEPGGDPIEDADDDEEDDEPSSRPPSEWDIERENHEKSYPAIKKRTAELEPLEDDEEDDDEDDAQNVTVTDSNHQEIPQAMLNSEKRLFVRSVNFEYPDPVRGESVEAESKHKRDLLDDAWKLALERMPRAAKPGVNYQDYFPLEKESRMKREVEEDLQSVQRDQLKATDIKKYRGPMIGEFDQFAKESVGFAPSVDGEGSRKGRDVSTLKKEVVSQASETTKAKSEPTEASKITGEAKDKPTNGPSTDKSAKDAEEVKKSLVVQLSGSEDLSENVKSTKETSTGSSGGQVSRQSSSSEPSSAETTKRSTTVIQDPKDADITKKLDTFTKKFSNPGLSSTWGNSRESEKWQEERRLGKNPEPDFSNLDIRYLGGNDLPIPPVHLDGHFNPEEVNPESPIPPKAAPLAVEKSGGQRTSTVPYQSLILFLALRP